MLWVEHVLIGFVLAKLFQRRNVRAVIMASIGPDLFMIPLAITAGFSHKEWSDMADTKWAACLVFLPHSFLSLLFVPQEWSLYWFAHIVADIVSHKGKWSIRPFYPLSNIHYEGYYEPWVYLCYSKSDPDML